ncbi:SDR family oxidoreductase [Luteibacter aegosomatissinici]|uniref:SDR family oxidoreductase n=1 Tax=Luteibacter aegosomatissinici TaxID=2911539 RepID=UPI001FF7E223|nr:SDR family oxidoreductase [Luteibacter aegosomatissinici]UPG96561.1 SDR family oxidoreductase [Luteibacter aegosomatissinici]
MTDAKTAPVLIDPTTKYPGPPFDTPKQSAPGTVHKLQPPADHGETSYEGHGRLKGRRALVTGGDSGIGRAAAIAFAREGAHVVITYLPSEEEDAREVIQLIEKEGVTAKGIPGDLKDEGFCRSLVKQASEVMGGLDILANVAGKQTHQKSIEDITTEQFDATFKTNVYAMFWLCKAALEVMPAGGTIINTASIQSYDPSAILLDYASTKAAIVAFTKALAGQVAERGIRVNAVAPGPVWTALQPSGGQPMDKLKDFGSHVPLKRPGQPVECAPVYVFFASDASSYVTGETYGVTGGNPLP